MTNTEKKKNIVPKLIITLLVIGTVILAVVMLNRTVKGNIFTIMGEEVSVDGVLSEANETGVDISDILLGKIVDTYVQKEQVKDDDADYNDYMVAMVGLNTKDYRDHMEKLLSENKDDDDMTDSEKKDLINGMVGESKRQYITQKFVVDVVESLYDADKVEEVKNTMAESNNLTNYVIYEKYSDISHTSMPELIESENQDTYLPKIEQLVQKGKEDTKLLINEFKELGKYPSLRDLTDIETKLFGEDSNTFLSHTVSLIKGEFMDYGYNTYAGAFADDSDNLEKYAKFSTKLTDMLGREQEFGLNYDSIIYRDGVNVMYASIVGEYPMSELQQKYYVYNAVMLEGQTTKWDHIMQLNELGKYINISDNVLAKLKDFDKGTE